MSVNRIKSDMGVFGTSIKNTLTHHKQFNNDDELIAHYRHDLKRTISALKYIIKQTEKLGSSHWNRLFKSNMKSVELFADLVHLKFDGIEDYYDEFDKFQAEQEIPMIHPIEKQPLVDSIDQELSNYLESMSQLRFKVLREWQYYSDSLKLRIEEMVGYLNDILKLIKKRDSKKAHYDSVSKKITKIMKKTTPLEKKEQSHLNSLDSDLTEASAIFIKIDDKVKSILPHALTFLDEFVENISKQSICKHLDIYRDIKTELMYFATYHGYLNMESDNDIPNYESIMDHWESLTTPIRLKIESFVSIIQDKNPDLLHTEIDDTDKTLKHHKIWNNVTSKVTKNTHNIKSKDHSNGIFNDYLTLDPLISFDKYQNPNMYRSETYHPTKIHSKEEVGPSTPNSINRQAPSLPPRSKIFNRSKERQLESAPSLPPRSSIDNNSMESVNSLDSATELSDSNSLSSISSNNLIQSSSSEVTNTNISKIYNYSKNSIKECPIPIKSDELDFKYELILNTGESSSITYKLERLNKLYDKILHYSNSMQIDRKAWKAKYDFDGVEPGDLSFKKGNEIEILFDFQSVGLYYNQSNDNWLIGKLNTNGNTRIGLVPSTYF